MIDMRKAKKHAGRAPGRALTPHPGAISGRSTSAACDCCSRPFEPRAGQRFCSPDCRLLAWAAGELLKRYLAGDVPGLQSIIDQFGRTGK